MQFHIGEAYCPRCHKPVAVASIERHPTRPDIAHHNYECEACGPVLTRAISLRGDSSSDQTL
jgi:hypothetical protein